MSELKVGEWYFCCDCEHCRQKIPLTPDPSKGTVKMERDRPDAAVLTKCPWCKQETAIKDMKSLRVAQVLRFDS